MSKDLILEHLETEGVSAPADREAMATLGSALVEEVELRGKAGVEAAIIELDEVVHSVMDEYSGSESEAEMSAHGSRINNEGLPAQVACVLGAYGVVRGEEQIRAALEMPKDGVSLPRYPAR